MKKIFAISLAASIALTMLVGCSENKSQTVKNDNTSVTEDEFNNDVNEDIDTEALYKDPENIVFDYDESIYIDLPIDDVKATFRGTQILPGRDTAEALQTAFKDAFVDESTFTVNRWTPEYIVGPEEELTVVNHSNEYKTEKEPSTKDVVPEMYMFKKMGVLLQEEGTQFDFLGITEESSFDDVLKTMNKYGKPYYGYNYTKETEDSASNRAGTLNYFTKDGYDIQFGFDGYGKHLNSVTITYTPGELSRREAMASLKNG